MHYSVRVGLLARVGLVGDIHAQDRALEAALRAFAAHALDAVFAVGDVVDGDGDADRCCALLEAHGVLAVRGNHDRWYTAGAGPALRDATPRDALSARSRRFLASLPAERAFATPAGDALLCHSLGADDMTRLALDAPEHEALAIPAAAALVAAYDVVLHGHTHDRGVRRVGRTVFVNAGTLHPRDCPCVAIVDFAARYVQYFDLDGGDPHDVRAAERLPFPPASVATPRDERDTVPPPGGARAWDTWVVYREPTYALSRGIEPVEYRAPFTVEARDEAAARARALELFRARVREESVGWPREVVRVECRPAAPRTGA